MKQTRSLMGMHITVAVVDNHVKQHDIDAVFAYFTSIDNTFSTYKDTSEITKINNGTLHKNHYSADMRKILALCELTKKETNGYFDIEKNGRLDPSGIVKGWAIWQAATVLKQKGFRNFYIDAGGDIQVSGKNAEGETWTIGIRNPFNEKEMIKILALHDKGIATSGTSMRGQHIYNPHTFEKKLTGIVSLTVIGPNVYEADRFATAAFAMEANGIHFIEKLPGFEAYMIDKNGIATYTSGFDTYVVMPDKNRNN